MKIFQYSRWPVASILALSVTAVMSGGALSQVAPTAPTKTNEVSVDSKSDDTAGEKLSFGLTDQILYQYLISEIAGQRGRSDLALRGLMDLAKRTRDPSVARRAVEVAFQARDFSNAIDASTLWLELDPASQPARQALSALAASQGTLDSAKPTLANMLAQPGKAPTLLMHLNSMLARFTDKAAVAVAVQELCQPYLKLAEAQYALASAHLAAKQIEPALTAIEEAVKQRDNWGQAAILKTQILRELSEDRASGYLGKFLAEHPDENEARQVYARLLASQKSFLMAREQFRLVAKQLPDDIEMPYAIGLISQQIEDYGDAEAQFKRVLEMNPRDANPVIFNLAMVMEAKKLPADAIAWYQKITQGDYFVPSRMKIAAIIAKRDGLPASRKFLQEAQAAETERPEAHVQLILAEAQVLRDAKQFDEAYRLLSQAVEKNPDTSDLIYDRAMVAEKLNKLDAMEADLRRVMELRPEHAHAYNALGYTFAERNVRLDEAFELVKKAVSLAPNDAFIQDSLGWIQFRQGKIEDAYKTLKSAYQLRKDPEIAAHLGEIMWLRGEEAEALKLWQMSILENPDNEMLASVIRKYKP